MDTISIDALVQEVQKELLSVYCTLTPKSLNYIDTYYQSRLSDTWSSTTAPHYHFWIDMEKQQDQLWIANFLIKHLGGTLGEKAYFQLSEEEFLNAPSVPLQKGKNAFIILEECKEEPLSEQDEEAWDRARKCLCDPQCPTFFLLASRQTINTRFSTREAREKYMMQLFRYRVTTETHFSADYYQQALNHHLDTLYPGKRVSSFDAAMKQYLETVIPKAINEGHDFLEDLKKRVDDEYNRNHHPEVIDERCVPYYHKVEPEGRAKTPEMQTDEEKAEIKPTEKNLNDAIETKNEPEPPVPGNLLPPLPKPVCEDLFDFDPASAPVPEKKNILLLTLSTINGPALDRLSSVSLTNTPGQDMLNYYYQLEPVPYLLMEQFKRAGGEERLDGIIMICSEQTRTALKKVHTTDCDSFYDTAENYFICKTSDYAQSCGYHLSYKEICTNIGKSDEASMKPEQRAKDTQKLIYDVIEELRILRQHYPNLNIHVDTHGGFRTIQEILNTALSLLRLEGIDIVPENMHAVDLISNADRKPDFPTTFFTSAKDTFHIMNFVTGIHECINYGQIASLHHVQNVNPAEQEVLDQMQMIAEGIQLCDVNKFEEGLKKLSIALVKLCPSESNTENAGYLTLFQGLIRDSYGEKLLVQDDKKRRVIDEIQWCLNKGFIQQALTLLESKMPKEMIKNSFLVSQAQNGYDAPFIFDPVSGEQKLSRDLVSYLRQTNTPKERWKPEENYMVEQVGYTKRPSRNVPFVPMGERTNYAALNSFISGQTVTIENTKKPSFPVRQYHITENPKAEREINVFLRLHMQLKEERNKTNHAGNDSQRYSITIICHAIEAYICLYEKIVTKLNS